MVERRDRSIDGVCKVLGRDGSIDGCCGGGHEI